MSSESSKPTLYERLGGVYSIAAVVDDFIDRVMRNPVLNANAAVDEAHHRVSAAGFKYYVTEMVGPRVDRRSTPAVQCLSRTNISRSPRASGPPSARTSMTRWRNSMYPRRSTRNCLSSWRAPRATLSVRHRLCDDAASAVRNAQERSCVPCRVRSLERGDLPWDGVRCQRGPLPRHQIHIRQHG